MVMRGSLSRSRCGVSGATLALGLAAAVGASAATSVHVTAAKVATPVSVQIGKHVPDCSTRGRHFCGWPERQVWISFIARVAATNGRSHYTINMTFTAQGSCSHGASAGQSSPPLTSLRAGQRMHVDMPVVDCPGVFHGDIVYDAKNNTAYRRVSVPGINLGSIDGVLAGTFRFTVPK